MPQKQRDVDIETQARKAAEEHWRQKQPDYTHTVYCDRHLGVKMVLALSWARFDYPGPSADMNRRLLWKCPKPECDRHYDPKLFGYHDLRAGSQPLNDLVNSPRGNHNDRPYMFVEKFGDGRRWRCPVYQCVEHGHSIADLVEDEEILTLSGSASNVEKEKGKAEEEMRIFQLFARSSGLNIDVGSPQSRRPPEPDVFCTISGEVHWFELGRLIDEKVAKILNAGRRGIDDPFSYDLETSFRKMVRQKGEKSYQTDGRPVDLLLHFDLRFGDVGVVQILCERYEECLKTLTKAGGGAFQRVWVFDEFRRVVIWPEPS